MRAREVERPPWMLFVLVLTAGCASGSKEGAVPELTVNQSGLSERIEKVSRAESSPESRAVQPEATAAVSSQESADPPETSGDGEADSNPGPVTNESDGDAAREPRHPSKPSPDASGAKVAFRSVQPEVEPVSTGARVPPQEVAAERDERTVRYRAREEERLKRAMPE